MFSWAHLGLVALGGALGTAARAAFTLFGADALGPALVPIVNVAGAFLLGYVVALLSRAVASSRTRSAQAFLGTGVLGGFTTYSALAVEASDLVTLVWGIATVIVGTAAAWAGLRLGGRRREAGA